MMRLLIPLILILVSAASFIVYTNPTFQQIKALSAEEAAYNEALTRSREVQEVRNKLISRYNTFASEDLQRLERLLPDHVDNIRLIIDIDNIAARYNLRIRNVELGGTQEGRKERSTIAVGSSGDPIGVIEVGFSVAARYEDFLRFLQDLERSLRIADITGVSFSVGEGDLQEYAVTLRTYWLH
jgi:Tfp pilus assembly protein PilO